MRPPYPSAQARFKTITWMSATVSEQNMCGCSREGTRELESEASATQRAGILGSTTNAEGVIGSDTHGGKILRRRGKSCEMRELVTSHRALLPLTLLAFF